MRTLVRFEMEINVAREAIVTVTNARGHTIRYEGDAAWAAYYRFCDMAATTPVQWIHPDEIKRQYVEHVRQHCASNGEVARVLNMNPRTVHYLLNESRGYDELQDDMRCGGLTEEMWKKLANEAQGIQVRMAELAGVHRDTIRRAYLKFPALKELVDDLKNGKAA